MDNEALALLRKRTLDPEASSLTPTEPSTEKTTENTEFIGVHCPATMKQSLQMFAGIERITLSQFVREILQMELLRLTRGETSSRESLMRERRAAIASQVMVNQSVLD